MIDISRANWQIIEEARDIAIVIDVIRAFSVASYGFAMHGTRKTWEAINYLEVERINIGQGLNI